jgi:hypothetical protein
MKRKPDDVTNLEKWLIFLGDILITLFSLGLMGFLKSRFSGQNWISSILFTIIIVKIN